LLCCALLACSSRPAKVPDPAPKRSEAIFVEIAQVLTHPRCVNCHPADDVPRQGDTHAIHDPPVTRGETNRGVVGMLCQTCHQDRHVELARVPGAPNWQLAPREMAWLGKTAGQICAQLKDPKRNGGRTLAQVKHHLEHDALVAYGWAPGANRAPAPGTQAQFAQKFQAWIDSGAMCPPEDH
jgi:hypothetical protein